MATVPAGNPKSTAIIALVFSAAALFSAASAESLAKPPATPRPVEECVKLLFDPAAKASAPKMRVVLCRDLLRSIVTTFKVTGELSPEYVAALKKLPRFKDDPGQLKNFICGISHAKDFDCTKIAESPL